MKTPKEKLDEFTNAVGSLAETLAIFRDELEKHGFDGEDSLELCIAFMECTFGTFGN